MSDITSDVSFGGWLRYFRVEKKITLREAARRIGMDSGNLSKLERSELPPLLTAKRVRDLCDKCEFNHVAKQLLISLAFQHRLAMFQESFFKDDAAKGGGV